MNESNPSEPRCAAAELSVAAGRPPGFVFGARPAVKLTPLAPAHSARSRTIYLALALFVGGLGIHNFYAGRILSGLLQFACTAAAGLMGSLPALGLVGLWLIGEILLVRRDGAGHTLSA